MTAESCHHLIIWSEYSPQGQPSNALSSDLLLTFLILTFSLSFRCRRNYDQVSASTAGRKRFNQFLFIYLQTALDIRGIRNIE